MDEGFIDIDKKVHRVLCSLARYVEFKESNAPSSVIELETCILTDRLNNLTFSEMQQVKEAWPAFQSERTKNTKFDEFIIQKCVEREILSLN